MNTYEITQITYAGSSKRHTEKWIVKAWRAPTAAEVRDRLSIFPRDGTILVTEIDFPVWELPSTYTEGVMPEPDDEWIPPPNLDDSIRRYLGKPPYDEPGNTSCMDAYFLQSLERQYGSEIVLRVIEELS